MVTYCELLHVSWLRSTLISYKVIRITERANYANHLQLSQASILSRKTGVIVQTSELLDQHLVVS